MNRLFDFVGMLLVIFAIAGRFKKPWMWQMYGVGCGLYIYLNVVYGIWGQVAINVVGLILACRNYMKAREEQA